MDLFGFILGLVQALAWPLTVLIVAALFRRQLAGIVGALTSLKFAGAEATFERKLEEAAEITKVIEPPDNASDASVGVPNTLIDKAQVAPVGAIMEAWKAVEDTARELALASGVEPNNTEMRKYYNLESVLAKGGLLPPAELETFRELRLLRNRAAHSRDDILSTDQAERYVDLADRLVKSMDALRRSAT